MTSIRSYADYSDTETAFLDALERVALYVGAMVVLVVGAGALWFIAYTLEAPDSVPMLVAMVGYFTAVFASIFIVTRHGG